MCKSRSPPWEKGGLAPYPPHAKEMDEVSSLWTNTDGTSSLRIHIGLFSDDFRVRGQKSAGGVYFISLSMPTARRSGAQAARVLNVTRLGGDSDVCITALLSDLIKAEREGVFCKDPGRKVVWVVARVSLFIADYVQIGHSGVIKGHNSLQPCNICSQHRGKQGDASSAVLAIIRTGPRYEAMRKAKLSSSQ